MTLHTNSINSSPPRPGNTKAQPSGDSAGREKQTQIALSYAYGRCGDPACSVFWVHANSETSFTKDYHSIARKLGVTHELDGESLFWAVRELIETLPSWVLVLGNVDDLSLFGITPTQQSSSSGFKSNLCDFVPRSKTGTVLWTSRDQQISNLIEAPTRAIHIGQMTSTEAETLLNSFKGEKMQEEAYNDMKELFLELDYLPLAISQAAAYMRRTSTSVGDYLSEIRTGSRKWIMLGRSEFDRHRQRQPSNSVQKTWEITIQYLQKENELAYDVLHTLAFVDNQNIPFDLISEAARLVENRTALSSQLDTQSGGSQGNRRINRGYGDHLDVVDAITRLCELSILTSRSSGENSWTKAYDMHKLIQEAVRYRPKNDEGETKGEAHFAKAAFQITNHLFPDTQAEMSNYVGPGTRREVRERCEQYLTHARQVGMWAELHGGEIEVACLLTKLFVYLCNQDRVGEMEPVITMIFRLRRKNLGRQHPDTIDSMASLSIVYYTQGKYKEAEKMHRHTLQAMAKLRKSKKQTKVLKIMINFSATLAVLGQYEEAEKLQRQLIPQLEELGVKHFITLTSKCVLGVMLEKQGRYDEAEAIHTRTLLLREEAFGGRHPHTLDSMNDLANVLYRRGRYEQAEELYRPALLVRREVLGRTHPDTLGSLNNLALALSNQGKLEEAEAMHREALTSYQEVLGNKHPHTLTSMSNLAVTLQNQGRVDEAERLHQQSAAGLLDLRGRKCPLDTLTNIDNLTWALRILRSRGKQEEAEIVGDKSIDNSHKSSVDGSSHAADARRRARLDQRPKKNWVRPKSSNTGQCAMQ